MKVKREDQNQELLEALEKDGFTLKFGDAGGYVDEKTSKRKYRIYASGIIKEEGNVPTEPFLYVAKKVVIKATLRALQPFKSEPIYIRSVKMGEEQVQIREDIHIVFDFRTESYLIEWADFKCNITCECMCDNAYLDYLLEQMREEDLPERIRLEIATKFLDRRDGIIKPVTETKYFTYLRFYNKLMEQS